MISRLLKLCFLLCALIFSMEVGAQIQMRGRGIRYTSGMMGRTFFTGRIVDSLAKTPLPSAVISVVTKNRMEERSVRNYVADKKGNFRFACNSFDQSRMEISVLGYKPHVVHLEVVQMGDEPQDLGLIRLSQSTQAIDEVVVKARIQMYKMKGDTVIYLPSAVNTMKDDSALEILRQMPGVEVDENGKLKIMGQSVERTYVNQKLLFGDDPTTALNQLEAKEVASIQAYDEVDEADSVASGKNARKRKVLNVVTFEDFTQSYTAKARSEAGADFHEDMEGKRPMRYRGSGEAGFYSEALQIAADGKSDNLDDSFKSMRQSNARISVGGRPSKKHNYNVSYGYDGNSREQVEASTKEYFPTDHFTSQYTADSTRRKNSSDRHNLSGSYGYMGERFTFAASLQAGLSNEKSLYQQFQRTIRDQEELSAAISADQSRGTSRSLNGQVYANWRMQNKNSLGAQVQFDLNDRQSRGVRRELRTIDGVETPLGWGTYAPVPRNSTSFNVNYGLNFVEAGQLKFESGVKYAGDANRNFYTDLQTGERDLARTEDAFDQTIEWTSGMSYFLTREHSNISAKLDYKLQNRVYEDTKIGTTDRRNFHFIDGSVSYTYRKPKKGMSLTFNTFTMPVFARSFSSRINDSNPLYVSSGNASLRPAKNYTLWFNSDFMGENSSYGFATSLALQTNPIMQRSVFFAEETLLPEYDNYRMPAGSTLTTPGNGASFLRFSISANYKVRIAPLKLMLDMHVSYDVGNPEVELYGKKAHSSEQQGSFRVDLTSNFSSKFRIKLSNIMQINYRKQFGNSNHDLNNVLFADVEWDIIDNLNLTANYRGRFQGNSSGLTAPDSHLLNLSLGWRVLKDRGKIALNAYDVVNDYVPIGIAQYEQYIRRSVNYVGSNYFTVSFEYKFNLRRAAKGA